MNTIRPCGCKGVRTCLQCEKDYNIKKLPLQAALQEDFEAWSYCAACEKLYPGWDTQEVRAKHAEHDKSQGLPFPGLLVQENFLSEAEGAILMQQLDTLPWSISQSGRRKQNFGPKTNFRKRKLQNGTFAGFPRCTQFIQQRFKDVQLLNNFQTIEQCSLEYEPSKGASIDPHIDDCWIWGERVVTVNCLGDAVLTLTLNEAESMPATKYNLDLVSHYEQKLLLPLLEPNKLAQFRKRVVRVPMPNLSLLVMYGPARYQFQHAVLREDIRERRVCLAYREFTHMYMSDGESQEEGAVITKNAQTFWEEQSKSDVTVNIENKKMALLSA